MSAIVLPAEQDAAISNLLQEGIDWVERPYEVISRKVGIGEAEVIDRIQTMKKDRIRQISAIFDIRTLGYQSSLAALQVESQYVDQAAAIINTHPGVTHNYRRNHRFNLWFTLAVPPASRLGLQATVQILGQLAQAQVVRLLPALKLFKIGVNLDMTGKQDLTSAKTAPLPEQATEQATEKAAGKATGEAAGGFHCYPITERDKLLIRILQQDLPVVTRPFHQLAACAGITADELLEAGKKFAAGKQLRRLAAVLHHRQAGFVANGMGVWTVPDHRIEETGRRMAQFKAVSHCYHRPAYPDWPYNLFTMVHGRSVEECEGILQAIERETGISERITLYSDKEYKKTRVPCFTPEISDWEAEAIVKLGLPV